MSESGFVKLNRGEAVRDLIKHYPNAYLLLTQIATRARRTPNQILKLAIGEALIGDYKECGLTEQKYRTAKEKLEKLNIITTRATNKGTIAKLIDKTIFDINMETGNEQDNRQITDNQRTDNEQITTNKKERMKECNNKKQHFLNPEIEQLQKKEKPSEPMDESEVSEMKCLEQRLSENQKIQKAMECRGTDKKYSNKYNELKTEQIELENKIKQLKEKEISITQVQTEAGTLEHTGVTE